MLSLRKLAFCVSGFLLWVLGFSLPSACRAAEPKTKPNILIILADDMGYGDVGVHGCKDIPTPHIDSIAKKGVRCSSGYVSAPVCSPSRAGLLTGRYQQRFGHESNSFDSPLSLKETTIADRLRAAGYVTGLVGKWHLGSDEPHRPGSRGFQEFFGFLSGANPYLPRGSAGEVPRIVRGQKDAHEKEYLTDALGREAVAYIDRHRKEPFFLYLAFNAPHGPLEAPPKYLKRFEAIKDEKRRTYAAMVSALDDAVGSVLGKLRSAGLEENTLVFFLNDNGGPTAQNASRNTPLRGAKAEMYEGGIRVPFFVRWKGRLPAGKIYERPVIQLDVQSTALAAAGVQVPEDAQLDGVNLLPYLSGQKAGDPHDALYWRFSLPLGRPSMWAIRQGDWILFTAISQGLGSEPARDGGLMLVNVAADLSESRDLSKDHPEKVKAMEEAWKKWNAGLPAPPSKKAK
jgi:arylsulfatase A-like enzyme